MAGDSAVQPGVIAINKPPGTTSRAVVDRVSRTLGTKNVGHAGTLDPLATGVVVICTGMATKLIDYIHQNTKRYSATFILGRSSPSDDLETELTIEEDPRHPSREELELAIATQRGTVFQRPCDFSAKLISGQRAYRLARKGRPVSLSPKQIEVDRLVITDYKWPQLSLEITCSTGTFVRAIGRDIAAAVGTTAVMERLSRTAVGPFSLEAALPLSHLDATSSGRQRLQDGLLPPIAAVAHLPCQFLTEQEQEITACGGQLRLPTNMTSPAIAAVDTKNEMVGVLRRLESGNYRLKPNFIGRS